MSVVTVYPDLEILKEEDSKAAINRFRTRTTVELHRQIVTVEFVKKDGTLRTMRSTLNVSVIPVAEQEKIMENANKPRKLNLEVRSVYDVEAGAWKSFRWDSVKSVTYNDEVM
jgi:riboflavin synthase alpha subunit